MHPETFFKPSPCWAAVLFKKLSQISQLKSQQSLGHPQRNRTLCFGYNPQSCPVTFPEPKSSPTVGSIPVLNGASKTQTVRAEAACQPNQAPSHSPLLFDQTRPCLVHFPLLVSGLWSSSPSLVLSPFCTTYTHDHIPTKWINGAFSENRVVHCPTPLAPFLPLFALLYFQKAIKQSEKMNTANTLLARSFVNFKYIKTAVKGFRV